MTSVEDRAGVLLALFKQEGRDGEAELLRELLRELREARKQKGGARADIELSSITIVRVEVESTPPCGGDAGHGAFTRLRLTDEAGSCWHLVAKDHDGTQYAIDPQFIELTVRGDDEQGQLLAALQVCSQVMRAAGVEPTTV